MTSFARISIPTIILALAGPILAACETPVTRDLAGSIDQSCSRVAGIEPGSAMTLGASLAAAQAAQKFDDNYRANFKLYSDYEKCKDGTNSFYATARPAQPQSSGVSGALLLLGAAAAGASVASGPTVIYPQTPAPSLPAPPITCRSFNNGISVITRCQ